MALVGDILLPVIAWYCPIYKALAVTHAEINPD